MQEKKRITTKEKANVSQKNQKGKENEIKKVKVKMKVKIMKN